MQSQAEAYVTSGRTLKRTLRRFGFFDKGFFADDDDDAGVGDVVAALIGFEVVTDFGAFGEADVAINDGAANARVAADADVIVQDGITDFAEAVDAHVVADNGFRNAAAGNDGTCRNDGVHTNAHAVGIAEDEFCGRILVLPGAERPGTIVQIEDRRNADEVHVGFVVGVERADVAPVLRSVAVFVDEIVSEDAVLGDDAGKNVLAEIVMRFWIFRIGDKDGDEELGIENVDAHGGVALAGLVRRLFRMSGLFFEADDAPVLVDFDDAELMGGLGGWNLDGADGDVRAGIEMLLEHLGVVHFVDVIATQDENVFRAFAGDGVNVLVDGVGRAAIPLLADAHLRRKNFDKFAEADDGRPSGANVAAEAERFVLSENENAAEIGVDTIGKSDVNDAIGGAERNGGLGAVASERPQAFALTTGEKNDKSVTHVRHGAPSGREASGGGILAGEKQEGRERKKGSTERCAKRPASESGPYAGYRRPQLGREERE